MKKKVIVAGHICLDITPVFPDGKVKSVEQVLSPGKLIQMGNADVHTGGAVANTGLAMKLLGADVSLMGKVGEDAFGDMILNILDGYDAKEGMIRDKESTTSYSVVLAIPGIDRIFLHHPGANHTFAVSDIDFDKVKEAALFHFGYPTLMESMYNNDGAELVHLMKSVQETGAATSLDLAAVDANSKAGQADWAKILGRTLPYVDFFVPSIEELCFMLDRDKFEELQVRADGGDITDVLDIEQDVKPLAEKCITLGCKVLLLKCGAKGMYLQTAGEEKLRQVSVRTELDVAAWAEKAVFEKSYIPEKILSGTGAGDTSIAAFLTAMLEGNTPEMCLHLAAATGASCVAAYDALSGLKSFEELKKKIEEFSTGMNRKLQILAALSHDAKLLILDEPTAGLDVVAREQILNMLREYMETPGRSILISSHISSDLEGFCDDLYMIDNGKIVLHEEIDRLLEEYGVLKVSKEQYQGLDHTYILKKHKDTFGYRCLTDQKQFYQENYPGIVIEKGNIDELITIMIQGEKI